MITKITKKDILKDPKILLNKFFYYKGKDINQRMFFIIYYYYKFDGKLLHCFLKHYYHDGANYQTVYMRTYIFYNITSFEPIKIF